MEDKVIVKHINSKLIDRFVVNVDEINKISDSSTGVLHIGYTLRTVIINT